MCGSFFFPLQTLSAMDQLRAHCAKEISELERVVGSQQGLSAALDQTYQQLVTQTRHADLCIYSQLKKQNKTMYCLFSIQVSLNQAHEGTLKCAADALTTTMNEQSDLMKEVCPLHGFRRKSATVFSTIHEPKL